MVDPARTKHAKFEVEVCLDPVPGWGHEPEDFELLLQMDLDKRISVYHPVVRYRADEFFVVYPSSNNSKHGVKGPYASLEDAKDHRGLSGGMVCRLHGDYYGIVVAFDWLWDWESESLLSDSYARRMIDQRAAWHKTQCEEF